MTKRLPWEITTDMFLSEQEVCQLVNHVRQGCDSPAGWLNRVIIETLLFSGIRNSEFCRLTLGDLQSGADENTLTIQTGRTVDRVVFISQPLAELISGFVKETRPGLLPPKTRRDDKRAALVYNERSKPYERTGLYRRVIGILADAGLGERASVQLLRHTYGYLAYKHTGGNLLFVQRQLGHAHPMITSVYARLVDESYSALANCIGREFAEKPSPTTRRKKQDEDTRKRSR